MRERDIAKQLATLREQLRTLGGEHPQSQRRIEALTRSLEHLSADLQQLRETREGAGVLPAEDHRAASTSIADDEQNFDAQLYEAPPES